MLEGSLQPPQNQDPYTTSDFFVWSTQGDNALRVRFDNNKDVKESM